MPIGSRKNREPPGYAESFAPTSITGHSKSIRSVARSCAESSFVGTEDSEEGGRNAGCLDCDWVETLRKTGKRSRATFALPPQFVPQVYWEHLPEVGADIPPSAHEGHSLVVCGSGATASGAEHVIVLGGFSSQEKPKDDAGRLPAGGFPASPSSPSHRSNKPTSPSASPHSQKRRFTLAEHHSPRDMVKVQRGISSFRIAPTGPGADSLPQTPLQVEWQVIRSHMPTRVTNCTACVLVGGSRVAVFGGLANQGDGINNSHKGDPTNSLHILDLKSGAWRDETSLQGGPPPCFEHAAGVFNGGHSMLVHGGRSSTDEDAPSLDTLRCLDVGERSYTWRELMKSSEDRFGSPDDMRVLVKTQPRRAHSLCIRSGPQPCAYVFGGYGVDADLSAGETMLDDLRVLDLDRCIWLAIDGVGQPPLPCAYHTATLLGPFMVVFGGMDCAGDPVKALHLLHLPTLVWTTPDLSEAPSMGLKPPSPTGTGVSSPKNNKELTRRPSKDRNNLTAGADSRSPSPHKFQSETSTYESEGSKNIRLSIQVPQKGGTPQHKACEPDPRRGHGAVALRCGNRPGDCSMIIFGGHTQTGDTVHDVYRLVLGLPREAVGPPQSHPYTAVGYVMGELERSIKLEQSQHREQVLYGYAQQKEIIQENRNIETRTLGVKCEAEKTAEALKIAQQREREVLKRIADAEDKLRKTEEAKRSRLRELEIEAEKILAKVMRVQREQVADFEGLVAMEDLELSDEVTSEIANPLCPLGKVERRCVQWHGAHVASEVVWYDNVPATSSRATTPMPFGSRSNTPVGTSARSTPLPEISGHPADRHSSAGGTSARSTPLPEISGHPADRHSSAGKLSLASDGERSLWEEAARKELRIIRVLRHPNLQEVYGAVGDVLGLICLTEPVLDTLVTKLLHGGAGSEVGLSECQRLHISCDISSALDYLHSKGVAHRHVSSSNVFIWESTGISAKLGGHFAARIACRAKCEPLVLKSVGEEHASHPKPRALGSVDVRADDVHAFGVVLLQMWKPFVESDLRNTEDAEARSEEEALAAVLCKQSAKVIRDSSVRLVVGTCLEVSSEHRPSARALHQALVFIQVGDIDEMPVIEDDPSKSSTLADVAVDFNEGEEDL